MLLRRIVNHSFLVLQRPPFFSVSSQDSTDSDVVNEKIVEELVNASGKLRLLDRLLQKLISTGHKVGKCWLMRPSCSFTLRVRFYSFLTGVTKKFSFSALSFDTTSLFFLQTLIFSQFTMALDVIEELLVARN